MYIFTKLSFVFIEPRQTCSKNTDYKLEGWYFFLFVCLFSYSTCFKCTKVKNLLIQSEKNTGAFIHYSNRLIIIWQREPRNSKANLKVTWEDILKACFGTKNRYINNIQIQHKHLSFHPCECSTYHLSQWPLKANHRDTEGPGGVSLSACWKQLQSSRLRFSFRIVVDVAADTSGVYAWEG